MTKYCELVSDPLKIAFCLEKALYIAKTERPGPCWLDIPLDVQGAIIETDELIHYVPQEKEKKIDKRVVSDIIYKLEKSERPVVFVGNGVRLAGAHDKFLKLIENPASFQPSPPKLRRKMVQIKGVTSQISIPKEPLPISVPILS